MKRARAGVAALVLMAALAVVIPAGAGAPPDGTGNDTSAYWTAARMAAATPRDLVLDERGLAYVRRADGSLAPHGHSVAAEQAPLRATSTGGSPTGKPTGGGSTDTTPPEIGAMDPKIGDTIGDAHVFSALVTDDESGVRSVSFVLTFPGGTQSQSYGATRNGDVWSISFTGFTNGEWSWHVVAKNGARKGGLTETSPEVTFTVDTSGGSGGGEGGGGGGAGGVVTHAEWTGGEVQTAAGRIYFEMPYDRRQSSWVGYVCSGTVATDALSGRSVILTAAHCVYDDVNKAFARNVMFIPDQANTTGDGTDPDCSNDPIGCWVPSFGVVDNDWAKRIFPNNVAWDYAYYVVSDAGAHEGAGTNIVLDSAAGSLPVQFTAPTVGTVTHALGYSYSKDPNFMYCAEAMGTNGSANWWLPSCQLSGGSSGGPWVQPMTETTGSGPIISVNSWGYTTSPGMAGPKLSGSSAECVFGAAKTTEFTSVTNRGVIPNGC